MRVIRARIRGSTYCGICPPLTSCVNSQCPCFLPACMSKGEGRYPTRNLLFTLHDPTIIITAGSVFLLFSRCSPMVAEPDTHSINFPITFLPNAHPLRLRLHRWLDRRLSDHRLLHCWLE